MAMEDDTAFQAWVKSRPLAVQQLIAEFPLGMVVEVNGVRLYVIGYTEADTLILSPTWIGGSGENYERALSARVYLCAEHLRGLPWTVQ